MEHEAADGRTEAVQGAIRPENAAIQDGDAICHAIDISHVMGAEDHRAAGTPDRLQDGIEQIAARRRVQAETGIIED